MTIENGGIAPDLLLLSLVCIMVMRLEVIGDVETHEIIQTKASIRHGKFERFVFSGDERKLHLSVSELPGLQAHFGSDEF